MAATELDPHYTPKFLNVSLTSIHSLYEKISFSQSVTDIGALVGSERDNTNEKRAQASNIEEANGLEATCGKGEDDNDTGLDPTVEKDKMDTSLATQDVVEDSMGLSSPVDTKPDVSGSTHMHTLTNCADVIAVTGDDEIMLETLTIAQNSELPYEGDSLQLGTSEAAQASPAPNGYISENCIVGVMSPIEFPVFCTQLPSEGDSETDPTSSSSGYTTESVSSTQLSSNLHTPNDDNMEAGDASVIHAVADDVSSGYASSTSAVSNYPTLLPEKQVLATEQSNRCTATSTTDTTTLYSHSVELQTPPNTHDMKKSTSVGHIQPDCDYRNMYNDLDTIRFTLSNPCKETEYVNTSNKAISGITFELCS